jgi:putative ATP-dependent endonuclease of the OLD family
MYISKATIINFRLIKNACLCFDDNERKKLSLLIGRNNTGKTSFIVLFNKYFTSSSPHFDFHDFPICLRESILKIDSDTDVAPLSIRLIIEIIYDESDSLEYLSDFILDLDPTIKTVTICFETTIDKKSLTKSLSAIKKNKKGYIRKNIGQYLKTTVYSISNIDEIIEEKRSDLTRIKWGAIDRLINFQLINAKREVESSESTSSSKKILSSLSSQYFNKCNKFTHDELDAINASIMEMDEKLDSTYLDYFKDFLKNAKDFLNIDDLKVISDLQSKEILSSHSKIVYGDTDSQLPEHLSGLGYLNILFLLLNIEIKKSLFTDNRTFTLFGKMDMPILLISTSYDKKRCPFLFIVKSNCYANNCQKMSGSWTIPEI